MKTKAILYVILAVVSTSGWCQNNMRETVNKAKSDLLEVLNRAQGQFDFGVEASEVREAAPARAIPFTDLDFENLLDYEGNAIDKLLKPAYKMVVPLLNNGRVITTVSVAEKDQEYEVIELISQKYTKDLSDLPIEKNDGGFRDLTIIHVQNLNVLIYKSGDRVFTEYGGRSLRQPADTESLMRELNEDAAAFVKKFGKDIKVGTLVD